MSKLKHIEPTNFLLFHHENKREEQSEGLDVRSSPTHLDTAHQLSSDYKSIVGRWTLVLIGLGCIAGGVGFFFGEHFQTSLPRPPSATPVFEISFTDMNTPPSANSVVTPDEKMPVSNSVPTNQAMTAPKSEPFIADSGVTQPDLAVGSSELSMLEPEKTPAAEVPVTKTPVVVEPKKKPVSETLTAKEHELLKKDPNHFTLVLFRTDNKVLLQDFLKKHMGAEKMSYYRSDLHGKTRYVVIQGDYRTRASALQALAKLPIHWLSFNPTIEKYGIIQKRFR